jgi:FHS family L-fucose permease-like MFS transporter
MGVSSYCLFRLLIGRDLLLVSHLSDVQYTTANKWIISSSIPEITDADMASQWEETRTNIEALPLRKQYSLFHATFAQFCYTGAQVAIAGYFINYVTETRPNTSAAMGAKFLASAQASFALGRFIGVAIMKFSRPRWVFFVYLTMCVIWIAPTITQRGNTGLIMLYLTLFFESVCFPTIVALGIRGLGKYTKRGAGFIIGGVAGGACVPPILGAVADLHDSTAIAMTVPLIFFAAAWSYSFCINFVPSYRDKADELGQTLDEDGAIPVGHRDTHKIEAQPDVKCVA